MITRLWPILLKLKKELSSYEGKVRFCHFQMNGIIALNQYLPPNTQEQVLVQLDCQNVPTLKGNAIFCIKNKFRLEVKAFGLFEETEIKFLKAYLPYCFLSVYAKREKRAITVAHFAQTLDGRIATTSGHSKWIGNRENLVHAHRMRALCDAILIGSRTLAYDRPKLTVRLVPGESPIRVILGTSTTDYSSLKKSSSKKIIVVGPPSQEPIACVDYLALPTTNGKIPCLEVLAHLFKQNIHSVYLEGGPTTTSNFICDKAIDIIQLHFSPLIFGSGRSAIVLPEIDQVSHGIHFNHFQFQVIGDSMMFVGLLN